MNLLFVIILVCLSGVFSGLTIGLMSLNKYDLKRKIKAGKKKEKALAKKVYAVRKEGNLLLCTLLLGNVAVNSVLSIFLGSLTTGVAAAFLATFLIVIFGEIVPGATFSRYALEVGAKTAWLVRFFMIILWPVAWPISKALDKTLGEELPSIMSRRELKEFVKLHKESSVSRLDADEEKIVRGALSFSDKRVRDVMVPRVAVFTLKHTRKLTKALINKIKKNGFTRIPVYKKSIDDIIGILYVKDLLGLATEKRIGQLCREDKILIVDAKCKLDIMLNKFKRQKVHMAVVYDDQGFAGVVTLEDVVEEILKTEIVDETDTVADMRKKAEKKLKQKAS